ncbi:MAG: DUF4956 domain-containing protein [Bacteroidales bacterium]|nr:DUF4956 domain-containing protein [Bacteroidales bacterium]
MMNITQYALKISDPDTRIAFLELFIRFLIHLTVLTIISRFIYYRMNLKLNYMFAQIVAGVVVFLLCGLLFWVELQLGLALGLFAIFAIINFRTATIPVKEMTYLFAVVGISAINGLIHLENGILSILLPNICIILVVYSMEKAWFTRKISYRTILYTNIELIKPGHQNELIRDLKKMTELDIIRFEIGRVDYKKGNAEIRVYYSVASAASSFDQD